MLEIEAWHFANDDGYLSWDLKDVKVFNGMKLKMDPDHIEMCRAGFHASVRVIDALKYAPGNRVCRVKLSGKVIRLSNKLVASEREILWQFDASRALWDFAIWCAGEAAKLVIDPDPRIVALLEDKRRYYPPNDNDALSALEKGGLDAWNEAYHFRYEYPTYSQKYLGVELAHLIYQAGKVKPFFTIQSWAEMEEHAAGPAKAGYFYRTLNRANQKLEMMLREAHSETAPEM